MSSFFPISECIFFHVDSFSRWFSLTLFFAAFKSDFRFFDVIRVKKGLGIGHYVGELHGKHGIFLGIEMDNDSKGKHDGVYKGKRYFQCNILCLFDMLIV